jgi:hypothetical protein
VRTTITLDPDVEALVRKMMRERGLSFKEAVNDALRSGLRAGPSDEAYDFPSYHMGPPKVPLEHALRLAGELEDEEIMLKTRLGR